jgi:Uncharacterized protein conserved in bacteria
MIDTQNNIEVKLEVTKTTSRLSNFELLRIISMLCIITSHYAFHGGVAQMGSYTNSIVGRCLTIGGGLGVNCFIMISSWFLIDSKFKFRSLLKIVFETFFYSIIIELIFKYFNLANISLFDLIKSFAPITFNRYWFVTSYVCLYLISSFINIYISQLNFKQYKSLMIVLTICVVVYVPHLQLNPFKWGVWEGSIIWFVYLYLLIGYYKLHGIKLLDKCSLVSFFATFFAICSYIVSTNILAKYKFISYPGDFYLSYNSILMLICCLSLFSIFRKIRIKSHFINTVASTAFGVYLIHDCVFRSYLWHDIVKTQNYYFSDYLLLHVFLTVMAIYAVCSLIDYLRMQTIERFFFVLYDKYFTKISYKIDSFFNIK